MKKIIPIFLLALILSGCQAKQDLESETSDQLQGTVNQVENQTAKDGGNVDDIDPADQELFDQLNSDQSDSDLQELQDQLN